MAECLTTIFFLTLETPANNNPMDMQGTDDFSDSFYNPVKFQSAKRKTYVNMKEINVNKVWKNLEKFTH